MKADDVGLLRLTNRGLKWIEEATTNGGLLVDTAELLIRPPYQKLNRKKLSKKSAFEKERRAAMKRWLNHICEL